MHQFGEINWSQILTKESLPFTTEHFAIIQTHISYVIITDKIVYKIKKSVDFGFLDFTTLEKRKYFCEREVILNRRLCGDLYIGVIPIIFKDGKYFLEGEGTPLEYAVKMRRLPEEGMMRRLLQENSLTEKHIDLIVDTLVPFYKSAETNEQINYYGTIEAIKFNTDENFIQTKDFVGKLLTKRKYEHIVSYTDNFLKNNRKIFDERIKLGYIRDGHGDLYSANICFDNLKRVYIFDCIEFNDRFRCGDVASDLAFLAMDLDYYRKPNLSKYFTESYVKKSGDGGLVEVLDFYKCYRAYVRGKIGCFTSVDEALSLDERMLAEETAKRYFDLAFHYAGGTPKVAIFMGLSGTGKTFLAKKFLEKTPGVYISSDITRKELLGLTPFEHHYEEFERGIYSPEITEKTYLKMLEKVLEEISYGRDVVVDATFRERRFRELFESKLRELGIYPQWILCVAPDEVVKERIERRKGEITASDALYNVYLAQKARFEEPQEVTLLKLDTSRPVEKLLKEIEDFVQF